MQGVLEPPEAIFAEAIAISSPDQRRQFLEAACLGDGELRRQIEKLVDYHFRAGDFLESAAVADLLPSTPLPEQSGDVVGRYRLLEQIGEGGMGAVFRAEQTEPVVRQVALKIIKPGMDTRQVIARFAAERQALALMDHPNIAKALDAGTTDSGGRTSSWIWSTGRRSRSTATHSGSPSAHDWNCSCPCARPCNMPTRRE
jgi:hypothetical protein